MKLIFLIFLIHSNVIACGQLQQNKIELDTIRIITLSKIPDNEIVFIDQDIEFRFSRNLILHSLEQWINDEEVTYDTLVYPKKDINELKEALLEVHSIYSDKSLSNFIFPITIFKNRLINPTQTEISCAVKTDMLFSKEIICKMIDNGKFECTQNGYSFKSVIYAKINDSSFAGTEEIRKSYLVGNKYEIKFCCFENYITFSE